jgi:hypothetical protein
MSVTTPSTGVFEPETLVYERQKRDRAERRLRELMRELRWHEESKRHRHGGRDAADDMLHRRVRQILASS